MEPARNRAPTSARRRCVDEHRSHARTHQSILPISPRLPDRRAHTTANHAGNRLRAGDTGAKPGCKAGVHNLEPRGETQLGYERLLLTLLPTTAQTFPFGKAYSNISIGCGRSFAVPYRCGEALSMGCRVCYPGVNYHLVASRADMGDVGAGESVSQRDAVLVREALRGVLDSAPFRSTRQCQALLTYIVEHSLAGEANLLRERVIGT